MSTIVARFNLDGAPVSRDAVAEMLQVQHRRGPGRKQVWAEGATGMGHGALLLADHTPYPLFSADGNLALVADMRLDNREELARLLDVPLQPDQDGPLLMAAYQRWGIECAEKLRGDFAFILWDAREQRVVAARDHFGVRSLFYHHASSKHLVLSSGIKGFWVHPDIQKQVDEIRMAEAIQVIDTDATRTMFEGVRGVPAGHVMTFTNGTLRLHKYWAPELKEEWTGASDDEYAEAFREQFIRAVRRRMRGTQAIGVELSGGLDSSSIAVVARDIRREGGEPPLDTISLRYPDHPTTDEGMYIAAVLETGHFNHRERVGTEKGTLTDADRILLEVEDPSLIAGNHHHVWMRLELAKQHKSSVLMTGYDGDSIVGHGFEIFHEYIYDLKFDLFKYEVERYCDRLSNSSSGSEDQIYLDYGGALSGIAIGQIRMIAEHGEVRRFLAALNGFHKFLGISRKRLVRRFARRLLVPYSILNKRKKARFRLSPLVQTALAQRTDLHQRAANLELRRPWPYNVHNMQVEVVGREMYKRTIEMLDTYAATFSIEGRHPFLDIDLVNLCFSLPSSQRLQDGWSRFVMRRALRGMLPDKVRLRPGKTAFATTSFSTTLERDSEEIQALIRNPGRLAEYADLREAQRLLNASQHDSEQDPIRLPLAVVLSKWLALHFG